VTADMSFKPTYERLLEVTGATELAEAFRLRLRGEWGPRPGDDDWTWASAVLDAVDEGGRGDAARDDVRKAVLRLFDGTRRGASTGPEPALAAGLLARVDWSDELRLSLVADLQGLVKSIAADIAGWGGLRRHEEGVESTAVEVADALFALGGPDACGGVAVLLEAAARALPSPDLEEATAIGALASVCRLADSESGERADAVMRRARRRCPGAAARRPRRRRGSR